MKLKKLIQVRSNCLAETKITENKLRSKLLAHSRKKFLERITNEDQWRTELLDIKNRLYSIVNFKKEISDPSWIKRGI